MKIYIIKWNKNALGGHFTQLFSYELFFEQKKINGIKKIFYKLSFYISNVQNLIIRLYLKAETLKKPER